MTDNIVQFPKSKIVRQNHEQTKAAKEKSKKKFANELLQELIDNVLMDLDNYGVDIQNEEFTRDFVFFSAALTSMIYRSQDLNHPFQKFMEDNVVLEDIDESMIGNLDNDQIVFKDPIDKN